MNAIEQLRETISFLFTYHDKEPYQKVMADLAAVDALHQAAAKVLDLDYGYEAGHPAWDALAAAVRRVEGQA